MKLKKIVCPTDFSKASRRALRVGADLAARDDGQLCLVHILEVEPAVVTDPNFVMLVPEYERTLHADAQRQLDALAASVKKVKVATIVGHGDPGNEIVRIAEEEDADLIAMSTHGRTGLKRVVLGSVAEEVVRNAGRPVLTLPAASK